MNHEPPTGLSRRTLISRITIGLAGGAIASLISACSQGTTAPAPAPTAAKPAAAAPTTAPGTAATSAPAAGPTTAPAAAAAGGTRGAGGTLRILMWQGPTILNPHLTQGTKDFIAARFCCEPLMTVSGDGVFAPVLAAEVPSKENGGLGADGKTVTYKLKQGVKWADGEPFTADDVLFTYQYVTNKETAATTYGTYADLDNVEVVDPMTVRLTFKQPTGGWYVPFTGTNGMVVPKHALANYNGATSRDAPFNLKAFGTGPYTVQEFKPGDVVTLVANTNYREPNKPAFSQIDIKGGGDAVSAARAVLQTGEYDYAWNLQVEAQVLNGMLQGGKGDLVLGAGGGVEQILFNMTDPNTEVDGERSSLKTKHPFLTDLKVRQAMALAIDRDTMAKQLYGQTGDGSANVLTTPTNLASKNTAYEFNIAKANQMLDDAGYKKGSDGIRVTPAGVRMHVVYQTTINSLRQKEQDIVKQGWQQIGIETELKSVDAGVFFSADAGQSRYQRALLHRRRDAHGNLRRSVPSGVHEALLRRKCGPGYCPAVEQVVAAQLHALVERRLQQAVRPGQNGDRRTESVADLDTVERHRRQQLHLGAADRSQVRGWQAQGALRSKFEPVRTVVVEHRRLDQSLN